LWLAYAGNLLKKYDENVRLDEEFVVDVDSRGYCSHFVTAVKVK